MTFSTVLFDLDGTLINSFPGIRHCANQAFLDNGYEALDDETLLTFVGPPLHQSFSAWAKNADDVDALIKSYRFHYANDGLLNYSIYDGIFPVLESLRSVGVSLAVATLKPTRFASHIIAESALGEYFTVVSGTSSDHSDETKADIITAALEELDVAPSRDVCMIGDRRQDVEGALSTGVSFIGAGWGFGSVNEFSRAGAELICENPSGLLAMLL